MFEAGIIITSSKMRTVSSERRCGQHRFTSLEVADRIWDLMPRVLTVAHSPSPSFQVLLLLPGISTLLPHRLHACSVPGVFPQCSFMYNHRPSSELSPVYLDWLQSIGRTFSCNPSTPAKWVSAPSPEGPKVTDLPLALVFPYLTCP